MKKMRIAVLIDAWFPFYGGGQVHVRETAKILREKYNCDINIFHGFSANLPLRIVWDVFVIPQVIISHIKKPFDIIHAHAYSAGVSGKILSVLLKVPIIYTVHGSNSLDIQASTRLKKLVGWNILSQLRYLLEKWFLTGIKYNAQISAAENFLKYPNVNKNIFVVENGAKNKFKIKKEKLKITIQNSKIHLLFVGRLEKIKGIDLLLKAVGKIKDKLPEFELRIVGRGSQEKALEELVPRLDLGVKVKFLGSLIEKELEREYQKADLFILPSLTEGQPLTLLEAWSNKLPVIATNVGQNTKMVIEGVNGFLAKSGSVESLGKTLLKAAKTKKNWKTIGSNGWALVKNKYTWENTVKKIYKIYKEVYGFR